MTPEDTFRRSGIGILSGNLLQLQNFFPDTCVCIRSMF